MKDKERYYIFDWYKSNAKPIIRHSTIRLPQFTGVTSVDAKKATEIFIASNGNLKKITILKIKECNEHGQIGEDIVPSLNENNIVPIKK